MSEQEQELRVRPEIQELHRLLVEFRARMGFKAFAPPRAVQTALLIRKKLKPLVEEAGLREAPQEVGRLTEQVLDRIDELIHSGEGYALYMSYLRSLFRGALKTERENRRSIGLVDDDEDSTGEDMRDLNLDEGDQADLGELPESADRDAVREHYDKLRGLLEGPELEILDVWIAERGERSWPTRLAEKMHQGEKATGRKELRNLKQLSQMVYRLWYKVLGHIDSIFGEWLREKARRRGREAERRRLEKKKVLAEVVLALIVAHIKPIDTKVAAVSGEGAAVPDGSKLASPMTLEHEQLKWLREQRQEPRMVQRAKLITHRSVHSILMGYRANKSNADLMNEVYGSSDAEDRLKNDLDLLHKWYEEITRDALKVIECWTLYERRMRKIGLKQFWEMRNQLPNFKTDYEPILKAVEKRVPFPWLPDQLGLEWEELAARVRLLYDNLKPQDKSQENPSLGD